MSPPGSDTAGGAGSRVDLDDAVAGAELELVREPAGVEEFRAVHPPLRLRARRLIDVVAVVPDEVVVLERRLVASRRDELEAAVDLGHQAVEIKAGAEDVGILELERGRPVAETRLRPGGLGRAQRARAVSGLGLLVVPGEEGGGVGG